MPPEIEISTDAPTDVRCDALVVAATASDEGPKLGQIGGAVDAALDGALSKFIENNFKGKVGEFQIVPTHGKIPAGAVAVVGVGSEPKAAEVRRAAGTTARRLAQYATIASTLHVGIDDGARAAAEGFLLGGYRFTKYRSDPEQSRTERVAFLDGASQDEVKRAEIAARATSLARDFVNEPAVTLTPTEFARRAEEMASGSGLEAEILDEAELERRGFGGILGVARGSDEPPRLITLRYAPSGAKGKVALVGKGITFDSGGLSLKDAKSMETMKTDMSGGAAVVAAMSALSDLDVKVEVNAYVPATENMPGGRAIKPGDTIKHYGGRFSEVLNTDAEGRLVLADALALASEQKPDAIIDVATLTGAMMVALGKKVTGYFSSDDALATEIEAAARVSGERFWRMPILDDYRSDIDSEIADVKNIGTRWGGAIYAALFLRDFVDRAIPWAHLDIAGPARADSDMDEVTRGGTGVATRTLIAWLEGRTA
jgi:leucyl aminopeptidase